MSKIKVAIIVPLYRSINDTEKISLLHLTHFLGKYNKFFLTPSSLSRSKVPISQFKIIKFPDKYFTGIKEYSQLMSTKNFYSEFSDYDYILIHQLDALVFSDQLNQWCNKGYDYMGAPWFKHRIGDFSHKKGLPADVGNGGFSLRKVKSFIKIIDLAINLSKRETDNPFIQKLWFIEAVLTGQSHQQWLNAPPSCYPFNEDGFWSLEAPKYDNKFRVAPFTEALQFSFEKYPRRCFELNNDQLPFGCHAWSRYDKEFWLPYLLQK